MTMAVETSGRQEAQVTRAGCGTQSLGFDLLASLVQVDLLAAEGQGLAPAGEGDGVHAEHTRVEGAGGLRVADREDEVIDAVDLHGIPPSGWAPTGGL